MPSKVILFVLALGSGFQSFAQVSEADSLESLIRIVPADTTKVWLLNKLVTSLREKDNTRALQFAKQARELAELLQYKNGLTVALENLGWILYRQGKYSQSFEISSQGLSISEEMKNQHAVARFLINLAAIHFEQKQYSSAIVLFKRAYAVSEAISDQQIMARSLNNISYAFFEHKEIDSAYVFGLRALAASEKVGVNYMVAFSHRILGDISLAKDNVNEALDHYEKCLAVGEREANRFIITSTLHRFGKLYSRMGEYDKALSYLLKNIDIARQFGFAEELERTYKLTAEAYFKQNKIPIAYHYQSLYINIHDSLYDQRNSEKIALTEAKYDSEIKQAQIELLTKDAALKEEQIKQQRVWMFFYLGCLCLFITLVIILYTNNRYNRKAKLVLQEKNREIGKQTQQLKNLNSTKDKLFSIISHDLRSPVASLRALMEIAGTPALTQEEFVLITKKLKRNLDSVYTDLDNLLVWAQTQLKGFQAIPEPVELAKIAEEKIELFKDAVANKNIKIVNHIPHDAVVLADRNHIAIIFRNLLANAIKFNAAGGSITLSVSTDDDRYNISVTDSGVGISREDMPKLFNAETHFTKPGTLHEKGMGIGLLLTKEFIEANQGWIRVDSELDKGSTFTFSLPAVKVSELV